MLYLSSLTPYDGPIETLRFKRDPRRRGLGIYEDVDGVRWDVHAIVGKRICARRVDLHPRYYSTGMDGTQNGFHEWLPYDVEVVS